MTPLSSRAPAKVNLSLHVLGRRADGFHALRSLVVFAGIADHLSLEPGPDLSLTVDGPRAGAAGPVEDNLVIRAARALQRRIPDLRPGRFHLRKNLPAAAGIGGGSADAAAALRLLARANGLPPDLPALAEAARETGSDIPVCLDPAARMMEGAGERVGPRLPIPPLFAVLVNCGVAVPTPAVFRRLGLSPGEALDAAPHPDMAEATRDGLFRLLSATRNDLEPPAVALAPSIGASLDRLRAAEGCRLARMSGSGATVFGLFDDCHAAARAAKAVRADEPGWWVKPTLLR